MPKDTPSLKRLQINTEDLRLRLNRYASDDAPIYYETTKDGTHRFIALSREADAIPHELLSSTQACQDCMGCLPHAQAPPGTPAPIHFSCLRTDLAEVFEEAAGQLRSSRRLIHPNPQQHEAQDERGNPVAPASADAAAFSPDGIFEAAADEATSTASTARQYLAAGRYCLARVPREKAPESFSQALEQAVGRLSQAQERAAALSAADWKTIAAHLEEEEHPL